MTNMAKDSKRKTLTKDRLVEVLSGKRTIQQGHEPKNTRFTMMESKELVNQILEIIKDKLEEGQEVKVSGFGKWIVKEKRSRPGRNPHTGERIEITARRVVTFHPSEKLRQAVSDANLDDSQMVIAGSHDEEDDE